MATKPDFSALVVTKLATMLDGNDYSADKINASSKSIQGRGAKLDVDIHATAIAAIHRSVDHKDATCAERLVNSMPKGSRVKTLVQWFAHHTNIVLTFDAKAQAYRGKMLKMDAPEFKPVVAILAAQAAPFWTAAEKVEQGAFDDLKFANAVAMLIKRATHANAALSETAMGALADLKVINAKLPVLEAVA